jgi:radical SAM superfamily enzyme YgiQ (UPF0313 family)
MDVCRDYAGGFGVAWPTRREDYGQSMEPCFHPFLPYASAVLSNEGYEYNLLDCQRMKLNKFQVLENVKKRNPDAIFSFIGLPSLKKDIELLNMIKDFLPNAFVIGVGTVCRVLQSDILLTSKIDVVLRNSYPYISNMIQLTKALSQEQDLKVVPGVSYVKGNNVIDTPESPDLGLDKLLPPNYDAIGLDGYQRFVDKSGNRHRYISILTGKGCPYSCAYCPYPLGFGKKWTHKSPNDIIDEIEYLYSRGIRAFGFRDQSFLMNRKHAMKVCEEILRRQLDIAWACEARVDQASKDLLELMKRSGCKRIHYGVETGDPTLIKDGKPGIGLETTRKALRLTKELDVWTNAHVILGWPDENLETLKRTYEFILEIDPDSVNWNMLTPYPGTTLYKMAKENNLILTYDWSKYTSHTVVMKTKWLDADQLRMATNKIIRDYSKRSMVKLLGYAKKKPLFTIKELTKTVKGHFT